jgi:hypothetical protein
MIYVMKINTIEDLEKCLATLGYTDVGGYPLYFITDDGDTLSFETVALEAERIKDAVQNGFKNGWRVIVCDVNWENRLYCAHSGEAIKSACEPRD